MPANTPLMGIRVVDLTRVYSGPYCTFMMAQAGAEVIKVESLDGDSVRKRDGSGGAMLPFALLNANKRAMTLDLKTPEGIKVLEALLKTADVLVENYRPGVMDRLGLGADRLAKVNPNLIVAHTTGYGQGGPYRDYPAMDLTIQAISGIIDSTGFPEGDPVKAGPAMVDFVAGTHLYGAIVSALYHRDKTGEVLHPDISMMDTAIPTLMSNLAAAWTNRDNPDFNARTGSRHGGLSLAPYNVYPAKDGYLAIISVVEKHWRATAQALGRDDLITDPRFVTNKDRAHNMQELDDILASETVKYTRDELRDMMGRTGSVCAPVRKLTEVLSDPHLMDRGMLNPINHPDYGELVVMGTPMRYLGVDQPEYHPSRPLGADNDAFLTELGYSPDDIAQLHEKGVI